MTNPLDTNGNVQVDFVWGNMPLQPNDARDEGAELDPDLDNHEIVYEGWNGYPGYTPGVTAPAGLVIELGSSMTVQQGSPDGMSPAIAYLRFTNYSEGLEGSEFFVLADNNGLVGQTVTFSPDVDGTAGIFGAPEGAGVAGQTFTIISSQSVANPAVPAGPPASDVITLQWAPVGGDSYTIFNFTSGTATITTP